MSISFKMNEDKAIEALVWLAEKQLGITPFYVSKVLYFADKAHLNRFGRPILGDIYIRMPFGPVPSETYAWIKGSPSKKKYSEKLREAVDVQEGALRPLRKPNMEMFSRTDIECLTNALKKYGSLDFGKLSRISHRETAWKNAPENGSMDYEDMIDPSPNREEIIRNLKEHSRQIVF